MQIMKMIGAIVIVLAMTLFGLRTASLYRERPRQIRALKRAITLLQAEIEYQLTPLPQALERVASRSAQTSHQLERLFKQVRADLLSGGMTVSEAFRASLARLEQESALSPSDCEAVLGVAETLSTLDRDHLDTQFQLSLDALTQAETEALEQGNKNARLWQYLGLLSGVMIVVLLY